MGVTEKLCATRMVLISRPFYKKFFLPLRIKSSYFQFQFRVSTLPKISVPSDSHTVVTRFISQRSHNCALTAPNAAHPFPWPLKAVGPSSSSFRFWFCARDGQSDHHISKLLEIITFHLAEFTNSTHRCVHLSHIAFSFSDFPL